MRVVSFPESGVPLELRRQQVALQDRAWPADEPSGPAPWHDPSLQPFSMLLLVDDRVVAALDVLTKVIEPGGHRLVVSGLSAVVTDAALQGRGYGRAIVEAGRELMRARGDDVGIFTCDRDLQRFYEMAGWQLLAGTVLIGGTPEDPFPSDVLGKVTLGSFFSAAGRAAADHIVGRRVELYPGSIDRLW